MTFRDRAKAFAAEVLTTVIADPRTQEAADRFLAGIMTRHIAPLVPIATAAATTSAIEQLFKRAPALAAMLDAADGAADTIVDVVAVTEDARTMLNQVIPDIDTGIAPLDAILDMWRPRG